MHFVTMNENASHVQHLDFVQIRIYMLICTLNFIVVHHSYSLRPKKIPISAYGFSVLNANNPNSMQNWFNICQEFNVLHTSNARKKLKYWTQHMFRFSVVPFIGTFIIRSAFWDKLLCFLNYSENVIFGRMNDSGNIYMKMLLYLSFTFPYRKIHSIHPMIR